MSCLSIYKKDFVGSEEEADGEVDCSKGVSEKNEGVFDKFDGLEVKNRSINLRWTVCETLDFSSFSFGALESVKGETVIRVVRVDGREVEEF